MSDVHVFFFRGMSLNGDDHILFRCLGKTFLDLGPVAYPLIRAFTKRGTNFHFVEHIGTGALEDMAKRGRAFLDKHPAWLDPKIPVHFFGHSAGGLVAKMILQSPDIPPGKVLSYITLATPHRGARLADLCREMHVRHPWSHFFMRWIGVHLKKHDFNLSQFTGTTVQRVYSGKTEAHIAAGRVASIVAALPPKEWCWPLRTIRRLQAWRDFDTETSFDSDGMIERSTQAFGEVIAELKIDHLRQCGFFGGRERFEHMCDVVNEFFVTTQKQQYLKSPSTKV